MPRRTSIRACFGPFSHKTQQALRARRTPGVGECAIFIRRAAVHAPALASLIGERRVRLARAGQTQNIAISVVSPWHVRRQALYARRALWRRLVRHSSRAKTEKLYM